MKLSKWVFYIISYHTDNTEVKEAWSEAKRNAEAVARDNAEAGTELCRFKWLFISVKRVQFTKTYEFSKLSLP